MTIAISLRSLGARRQISLSRLVERSKESESGFSGVSSLGESETSSIGRGLPVRANSNASLGISGVAAALTGAARALVAFRRCFFAVVSNRSATLAASGGQSTFEDGARGGVEGGSGSKRAATFVRLVLRAVWKRREAGMMDFTRPAKTSGIFAPDWPSERLEARSI